MKQRLLQIIFLLIPSLIYGQDYHNFPVSNDFPIWGIKETKTDRIENTETYKYFFYSMIGDTLIVNETYNKIYQLSDTLIDNESIINYICCIRESNDSCIYRINAGDTTILRLFDFSLKIGDTTHVASDAGPWYYQLSEKQFIQLNQETYTKYIGSTNFWIDGIGNTDNGIDVFVVPKPAMIDYSYELKTFKLNNNLIYGRSFSDYLLEITFVPDIDYNNLPLIYPNPSRVNTNIQISSANLIDKLIIFDMIGNIALIKDGQGFNRMIIDSKDLDKGMYIIRIIEKSGFISNSKVMIK